VSLLEAAIYFGAAGFILGGLTVFIICRKRFGR
jgi:hypothetical protein